MTDSGPERGMAASAVPDRDRCPVCLTDAVTTGGERLPCCRNYICVDCMTRWRQMSNHCPLCKAQLQPPEEVISASLTDALRHLNGANDCLQRLSSVAEHVGDTDVRAARVRPVLNDLFEKAMKLGLFGTVPSVSAFNIEVPGEGIFAEAVSRDIISFMLAVGARSESPDFSLDFEVEETPRPREEAATEAHGDEDEWTTDNEE